MGGPAKHAPLLVAVSLAAGLLPAGCAREAPEVHEVRVATEEYLTALARRDVKVTQERSTCVAPANSLIGGRVLAIEPVQVWRRMVIDSLIRTTLIAQRTADSLWSLSSEAAADSLFRSARAMALQAAMYRNAARAARFSNPSLLLDRNALVETRLVRTRVRYAGPAVGPKPVDREILIRFLRVPAGKWIAFSFALPAEDPGFGAN